MTTIVNQTVMHSKCLEMLFSYQVKVMQVFKDVLGLYEINHISLTRINKNAEILSFSSTPSLEYNLFNSNLWQFDKTYQSQWHTKNAPASWPSLYSPMYFKELYYLKQQKHRYPISISLPTQDANGCVIYSIASRKMSSHAQELFSVGQENLQKIGQYCAQLLLPLLDSE